MQFAKDLAGLVLILSYPVAIIAAAVCWIGS